MDELKLLVIDILSLPVDQRSRENVVKLKRSWAKAHKRKNVPTNIQVLKTYYAYSTENPQKSVSWIEWLLKKRSIRSQSGIVAVQVLTKPFWCPGKCIFCPNDATMPKSYINTQPGAMRALLNHFDPYKQVYNRLLSLRLTWHATDKIEMIVLWWTWDVYPKQYKIDFVKWLYDACNTFTEFLSSIEIDYSRQKAARYTTLDNLDIVYPSSIHESIHTNQTADHRIIWLTVETRPEYVTHENCQFRRELWVTRMEMGIQTLHNDVHDANKRWHDNEAIRSAMHTLRQYWFKISNHYMPGLYTSTKEKDIETFRLAFSSPYIKSDELKFYPTAVIPNTPLYDLYKAGDYKPLDDEALREIIIVTKTEILPPYTRIKRLARDFDTNEVVAGANTPNLRQLVMNDMAKEYALEEDKRCKQYVRLSPHHQACETIDDMVKALQSPLTYAPSTYTSLSWEQRSVDDHIETYTLWHGFDILQERNFVSLCTRSREYRNKHIKSSWWALVSCASHDDDMPFPVIRRYRSSNGEELFISFEDRLWYLYGFTRLLLPDAWVAIDFVWVEQGKALIRELHVYWNLASLLHKDKTNPREKTSWKKTSVQHRWIGSQLMHIAELIAFARTYVALSVISWIWVRKYYEKLWYTLEWTYMVKYF